MSEAAVMTPDEIRTLKSLADGIGFGRTHDALRKLLALTPAQEWQDISTAPKDRTIIITGRYANGRAYVEEGFWSARGHFNSRKFDPPTHWMPMPQPHGGWDAALIADDHHTQETKT